MALLSQMKFRIFSAKSRKGFLVYQTCSQLVPPTFCANQLKSGISQKMSSSAQIQTTFSVRDKKVWQNTRGFPVFEIHCVL